MSSKMFLSDDPHGPVIPNPLRQIRMCRWRHSREKWHRLTTKHAYGGESEAAPSDIEIVTWNVDFNTPMAEVRMNAALDHLEKEVFQCQDGEAPNPCVILLQEVHVVHGLNAILGNSWVQEHFLVTPTDTSKWPLDAQYGNVTLVEKSIPVEDAHILEFGSSDMGRTGVIVDIKLSAPAKEREPIFRIINTHLESLASGDGVRPEQMKLLSKFLKGPQIRGGIICGDMNPIGAADAGCPAALGLRDAWRKGDKDEEGFTWGEQPEHAIYPPARFDKVLYLGRKGYRVEEPERIGVGLQAFHERLPRNIFVSDHCGLFTKLHVLR